MSDTTQHTPGPWVVGADGDWIASGPPLAQRIAVVDDTDDEGECRANARLIAAAPELLAACELWDQGFEEAEQFDEAQFLKWVNDNRRAARAAIAKAKGG